MTKLYYKESQLFGAFLVGLKDLESSKNLFLSHEFGQLDKKKSPERKVRLVGGNLLYSWVWKC